MESQPGPLFLGSALRLVRALLPVAILYVGKLIIDEVAIGIRHGAAASNLVTGVHGAYARVWMFLALELALAAAVTISGRVVSMIDALLTERYTNATSVALMEHAASLDLADFEEADVQDSLDRARRQITGRGPLLPQLAGQAQDILTVAIFAVSLMVYTPWLTCVVLVALVPSLLVEVHFNARSYEANRRRTPERRELDYLRYIGANAPNAKEIKSFGLNRFLIDRYTTLSDAVYGDVRRIARRRMVWGACFATVGTLGYYAAFAFLVYRTMGGQFSIGDLTFLAGSFKRLRTLLEGVLAGVTQVANQLLYLDDLWSFFKVKPKIVSPLHGRSFPRPLREGFALRDVGLRYRGADRWAVRHLSFVIRPRQVVALVGENGAGKTTIVKLLSRLYDPDEGAILLDGYPLGEYDLDDLRANVGVIFQDFIRYNFTAGENIAVGDIDHLGDELRIARSARRSLADQVIARHGRGYKQMLGKLFREGVDLSGGEWQKIAIARAYMRNASLLILDEPTAALDARAEQEVFRRFRDLPEAATALIISHRFSTVRMADRIVVLDRGEVLEEGTHDELMASGGRYAELFEMQAASYR